MADTEFRHRPQLMNGHGGEGVQNRGQTRITNGGMDGVHLGPDQTQLDRDIAVSQIRHAAQQMHSDFVDQMNDRLNDLLHGFVGQVTKMAEPDSPMTEHSKGKRKPLAEKVFVARESLLTQLLMNKNIQTIYNIFVAILIVLIMNTFVTDLIDTGSIRMDFLLLQRTFGKAPIVLWTWCMMQLWAMTVFYITFQYWAQHASSYYSPFRIYIPNLVWLGVYIVYQSVFLYVPFRAIVVNELPLASSIIITTEQIRILMKMHAFLRENIPRALAWKQSRTKQQSPRQRPRTRSQAGEGDVDDIVAMGNRSPVEENETDVPCPDFSKYLYFLFCPTLVYRDNYPRTSTIRWDVVRTNFLQVLGCLFYTFYLYECFCLPIFKNFSQESMTLKNLARVTFSCMLPAMLMLVLAFFAVLHSWFNAFAEMLRFADRQFYRDWWNCKSFSTYYRTWNIVVHEWLYTYIYRDCQLLGLGRLASSLMVFGISAVFHEYILAMAFGYFYPVLMLFFGGFGVILFFIMGGDSSSSIWNIFMWLSLICGTGLLMSLYSFESYARIHCQYDKSSWLQLFIPQSWTCEL